MLIVVSPYHLTTREPAAMVSLLLGEGAVTMLPAPLHARDRAHVEHAAASIPNYVRFMESWRWSLPLWREGVIGGAIDGAEPADDVRRAYVRVAKEPDFASLRVIMKQELFENEEMYLDAVSRDVLRAGPDPGITVPVAAGLDAFAARHGLGVARSEPSSVVQRAEAQLGHRVLAVAIPALLQASASRLLFARRVLAKPLELLRTSMAALATSTGEALRDAAGEVNLAAREYSAAFNDLRSELLAPDANDDDDDVRTIEGAVSITGLILPPDAALRASRSALRTLAPAGMADDDDRENVDDVARGPRDRSAITPGGSTFTMLIKALGRRSRPM
jgi:hypothetical protein